MPGKRDISIYAGDTYVHEIRIKNADGTAINIGGRTYSGSIKLSRTSESVISPFIVNITNAANGVVVFSLTSSNTALITPGTYYYDFQEENVGIVTTLLTGKATVTGQITNGS